MATFCPHASVKHFYRNYTPPIKYAIQCGSHQHLVHSNRHAWVCKYLDTLACFVHMLSARVSSFSTYLSKIKVKWFWLCVPLSKSYWRKIFDFAGASKYWNPLWLQRIVLSNHSWSLREWASWTINIFMYDCETWARSLLLSHENVATVCHESFSLLLCIAFESRHNELYAKECRIRFSWQSPTLTV